MRPWKEQKGHGVDLDRTGSSVASALGANSDVSNPHSCLSIQTNGLLQLISSLRQEFYVHKKDVMDQDPKLLIH